MSCERILEQKCNVTSCDASPLSSRYFSHITQFGAIMCNSMFVCCLKFGTVFLVLMQLSSCYSVRKSENQLSGLVAVATPTPVSTNSNWTMESHPTSSSTIVPANGIHLELNSSNSNDSLKTATAAPTTVTATIMPVSKLPKFTSKTSASHLHKHQTSSTTYANITSKPTITLLTPTTMTTSLATTTDSIIRSHWDGWKQLLTKNYWKKRINDAYYLMELLIPVAVGIALCLILMAVFNFFRCLILLRYRRRPKSRLDNRNGEKLNDNTWMLLENMDSEEDVA